jgi:branched-chain amino acid transport system ATP-binding protein
VADALLELCGVAKRFGGFQALAGVDLTVAAGEIVGLIGPNGSGKTTLINIASGLLAAEGGDIRLGGQSVLRLPAHRRVALGLNRTFQVPRPFPTLTLRQNLEVAVPGAGGPRDPAALLEAVELAPLADRRAGELTSVQQKLLDLARALATGPRVLLVDELATGLTPAELVRVAARLRALAAEGLALVVVEHLMPFIDRITDRVVVMNAGQVLFRGTLREAARDAQVVDVFLGAAEHAA